MFVSKRTPADRTPKPVRTYRDGMDVLADSVMDAVLDEASALDPASMTDADVAAALASDRLTGRDLAALLSPAASGRLAAIETRAAELRTQHFGLSAKMFTPLYLANFCSNDCSYCGFGATHRIKRGRLTPAEQDAEFEAIAATGLTEILLLTGESEARSGVEFVADAAARASKIFSTVGVEIQPLNIEGYARLADAGVARVSVYQETYDEDVYARVHTFGPKRVFPFRFDSQERALRAGVPAVAFGALLGLGDWRSDALATAMHARAVADAYPAAHVSFSVPRLRPHSFDEGLSSGIGEDELLQVMLAYRLFVPTAGLTISTRERAEFRDRVIRMTATAISAGVSVGVGGHASDEVGDGQFEIDDARGVAEVAAALRASGLQPE